MKQKQNSALIIGYSTKYALTGGIEKVTIDLEYGGKDPERSLSNGDYVYMSAGERSTLRTQLVWGKTFFVDLSDAKVNARHQANNAIRSCKLKLAKLEKIVESPKIAP